MIPKLKPAVVAAGAALALLVAPAAAFAATSSTGTTWSTTPTDAANCAQPTTVGQFACLARHRTDHFKPFAANGTPSGYAPSDLRSAYALPSTTNGVGQRVYIVDAYDDPNAEADLTTYRAEYGLPVCTTANGCFQKLNQTGTTSPLPSSNKSWSGEISLDLDMVSAICPNCGITLVEAKDSSNNLFIAVKEATTLGAKFVSMSWGGSETSSDASLDSTYFNVPGVVYSASSGDTAYRGGIEYPSSSPDVISVGGTSLSRATNSRGWTESVWKTSTSEGASSGCSSNEAKPAWQSIISTTVCAKRADTDVSAVADPATGVAVYQSFGGTGWMIYGGTSAAAPIITSTYALVGTPTATHPASLPYATPGDLNDVTTGNNGTCTPTLLCTAAVGWDGPTGLGTPNGLGAFGGTGGAPAPNTVTVTNPGTQSWTAGKAVSLQVQATDSGGAALTYTSTGLPSGLAINAGTGLISGTPAASGTGSIAVTATDSTSANGSATFSYTVAPAVVGSCAGQLITNPGFESGATGWAATAGVINTDGAHSRTGVGYAWLDGYGTTHTDTLTQTVTIPTGCQATLTYYLAISSSDSTTAVKDTLNLTANGTTVQSFSNINRLTSYTAETVNLAAYAGQSVTLSWTGTENATKATSFFIDDTALALS